MSDNDEVYGIEYSLLPASYRQLVHGERWIKEDIQHVVQQITAKLVPRIIHEIEKRSDGRLRVYITARITRIPDSDAR